METIKALEILDKSKGYEYALMTTFGFDIGFFERFILNRLYDNDIKMVSLFVDSNELLKSLEHVSNSSMGRKYIVHPIETKGAFHPKLVLLLGTDRARLFIGSANITTSGYLRNNEILHIFDYNADYPENLKVITSAIDFFERINELSYKQDEETFEGIKQLAYYGKTGENDELFFINNLSDSIFNQVNAMIDEPDRIDIAVPFYDNDLSVVQALSDLYPKAKINLFVQNKKSRFPVEKQGSTFVSRIYKYRGFDEKNTAFYHGKVFRFDTKDTSYILYGSANCTSSAFLKAFVNGSNIECDVLEKGTKGEFDSFFDSFMCIEEALHCEHISYNYTEKQNFYYKYGILEKELRLYFGVRASCAFSVFLGENKLNSKIIGDDIVICVDTDLLSNCPDIFEIKFVYDNKEELVKCWFVNKEALYINRTSESRDVIFSTDFDNKEDRYIEDKYIILKETSLTPDELQNEADFNKVFGSANNDKPDDETDSDEDGIISYVIPDADCIQKYNKYKRINTIRLDYIRAYYEKICKSLYDISTGINHPSSHSTSVPSGRRLPTDYENRFKRFIKKRINDLVSNSFLTQCSYEHYLSSILVFINVFDKYTKQDKVDGLFDADFIVESKMAMIVKLLEKAISENLSLDEMNTTNTIQIVIQAILERHFLSSIETPFVGIDNKVLLSQLNKLFDIRAIYKDYVLTSLNNISESFDKTIDESTALEYIDNLFGYKDDAGLRKVITQDYGNEAVIDINDETITITVKADNIVNHYSVRPNTLKELVNYCVAHQRDRFAVIFENAKPRNTYGPSADPIKVIAFNANIKTASIERVMERYSGKKETQRDRLHVINKSQS